ncbi:MAG: hypothetical protein GY810_07840 [Aureispira sp.]|nr:hypothetical protein [Aureispira sp.]
MGIAAIVGTSTSAISIPATVIIALLAGGASKDVTEGVVGGLQKETKNYDKKTESVYKALSKEGHSIDSFSKMIKEKLNTTYQNSMKIRHALAQLAIENKPLTKEMLAELEKTNSQTKNFYGAVSTQIEILKNKVNAVKLDGLDKGLEGHLLKMFILDNITSGSITLLECDAFKAKLMEFGFCTKDDFVDSMMPGDNWDDDVERLRNAAKNYK